MADNNQLKFWIDISGINNVSIIKSKIGVNDISGINDNIPIYCLQYAGVLDMHKLKHRQRDFILFDFFVCLWF